MDKDLKRFKELSDLLAIEDFVVYITKIAMIAVLPVHKETNVHYTLRIVDKKDKQRFMLPNLNAIGVISALESFLVNQYREKDLTKLADYRARCYNLGYIVTYEAIPVSSLKAAIKYNLTITTKTGKVCYSKENLSFNDACYTLEEQIQYGEGK